MCEVCSCCIGRASCTLTTHMLCCTAALPVYLPPLCAPPHTHTQEKLCLDLDDAQARDRMQQLINESATALMPQIVETTHRWAQYWR